MQIINLDSQSVGLCRNSVLVIGNFDAVHLGHQYLLKVARDIAIQNNLKLSVLTFEPHPRRLFRPDDTPFRITPPALKLWRLEECAVDKVIICPFDWGLAEMSASQFMQGILQVSLGPSKIVVGEDFHFGMHRAGTIESLRHFGFDVLPISLTTDHNRGTISATRVRGLIQSGRIDEANGLLGWKWEIWGDVQHGDKRGRTIGYPTANLPLGETIHPAYGVYAGAVQINHDGPWHKCATNIGIRPMFESKIALVECHILDFDGDLYGQKLRFRPLFKIRDEAKFSNIEELVVQMERDCQIVRDTTYLSS
jgi:riboflavin kinase/FMN adenylyltransferase